MTLYYINDLKINQRLNRILLLINMKYLFNGLFFLTNRKIVNFKTDIVRK